MTADTAAARRCIAAAAAPPAIGPCVGFAEINQAYGAFFTDSPPARVTVGVTALPKGAQGEIDAIVAVN
jgi:2-iminobutanoate/2-iminopropanoate deaminase